MPKPTPLKIKFDVDWFAPKPDTRTVVDRVADVLSESHREDTSHEFRLGLLQGALAVAMPALKALEPKPAAKKPAKRTRRSRRRA
jgi:hypothetical protein